MLWTIREKNGTAQRKVFIEVWMKELECGLRTHILEVNAVLVNQQTVLRSDMSCRQASKLRTDITGFVIYFIIKQK